MATGRLSASGPVAGDERDIIEQASNRSSEIGSRTEQRPTSSHQFEPPYRPGEHPDKSGAESQPPIAPAPMRRRQSGNNGLRRGSDDPHINFLHEQKVGCAPQELPRVI